jgi:hypothetical protein
LLLLLIEEGLLFLEVVFDDILDFCPDLIRF